MPADYYTTLRRNLTPRMAQYMAYIEDYYAVHRQPLAVSHFCMVMGIKNAYKPLRKLARTGLIERPWGAVKPKGR